jgi:colicin import membrane protein
MAANKKVTVSIADLESQIAKVSVALAKARAQKYSAAEKAVQVAKKAADAAAAKVKQLKAKGIATPAAKARLQTALDLAVTHKAALVVATSAFDELKAAQKLAD